MSAGVLFSPGPMQELPRDYLDALRERCLKRANGDYALAERLVEAVKRGRAEADQAWRDRL